MKEYYLNWIERKYGKRKVTYLAKKLGVSRQAIYLAISGDVSCARLLCKIALDLLKEDEK